MIPEARTLTQEELEAFAPPSDLKRGLKVCTFKTISIINF